MENAQKNNDLVKTIFKGVGVAMGIAVIVLSVLGTVGSKGRRKSRWENFPP